MTPLRCAVVLLLVVAACSADEPAAEVSQSDPGDVVAEWLAAVGAVDLEGLAATTAPTNVALVAGAENGFTVEQMEAVVDAGLPVATRRAYWTSFEDSFTAFLGGETGEITVAAVESFDVDGTAFAAVTLERLGETSEILAQQHSDGWVVDMVATAGPALSVQVRRLVEAIVLEGDDEIAFTYATLAVRSLSAALARQPDNRSLELELEAIEDLPIDLSR